MSTDARKITSALKYQYYACVRPRVPGMVPAFPIDMLRYDRCTPYNEIDSNKIIRTFNERGEITDITFTIVVTKFSEKSNEEPWTVARWQSFGWEIQPLSQSLV